MLIVQARIQSNARKLKQRLSRDSISLAIGKMAEPKHDKPSMSIQGINAVAGPCSPTEAELMVLSSHRAYWAVELLTPQLGHKAIKSTAGPLSCVFTMLRTKANVPKK